MKHQLKHKSTWRQCGSKNRYRHEHDAQQYRKKYEKVEAYYGDFYNDTIGARLLHEFKDFKLADSDEVIDLLNKAKKMHKKHFKDLLNIIE